jgi:hypothetical protein
MDGDIVSTASVARCKLSRRRRKGQIISEDFPKYYQRGLPKIPESTLWINS